MELLLTAFGCSFLGPIDFFGMPPEKDGPQQKSDPVGMLYFLCNIHATCITVFIRSGFGMEGIGVAGAFSLIVLVVLAAVDPVMGIWLCAWIIAVIVQRIITYRRISKGAVIHSRFAGRSLLLNISFFRKGRYVMPGQSHYFGKEKRSRDGTRGDLQQVLVIPASHFPFATYAYLGVILCQE